MQKKVLPETEAKCRRESCTITAAQRKKHECDSLPGSLVGMKTVLLAAKLPQGAASNQQKSLGTHSPRTPINKHCIETWDGLL